MAAIGIINENNDKTIIHIVLTTLSTVNVNITDRQAKNILTNACTRYLGMKMRQSSGEGVHHTTSGHPVYCVVLQVLNETSETLVRHDDH